MEEDSVLGKAGLSLPVHEFHYWDVAGETFAATAKKPAGGRTWRCMQVKKETAAGFPHLYFPAEPAMVTHFLDRCRAFREKRA
jgi:cobyrinic acid a,c-diamide synthase